MYKNPVENMIVLYMLMTAIAALIVKFIYYNNVYVW